MKFCCRVCHKTLNMEFLKKGSYAVGSGKGKCKKCHSLDSSQIMIRKKVRINPQDYFQCDDCDRYMYVFPAGNHLNKKIIDKCKFCGSKNINDLI